MARKRKQLRLHEDPRWADFVKRFAFDLNRFAFEICGQNSTWQQCDLFNSVQDSGSRTSVSSGHGTGKSRSLGIIATWHLLCYHLSNTLITAPKIEQVKNVAWKEITDIKDHIARGPYAWLCEYYTVEDERVYVNQFKKQWFVIAKTAPRGTPENLAGMHRDWYLVIADEASGIPDANYGVLTGGLTDKRNRMLMTSQPTRNTGFFYDTHHKLSKARGGPWNNLILNSEESPLVSLEWLRDKRHEYGGIDDPQYQIKVRGAFPENLQGQLLSRSSLEKVVGLCCIADNEDFGYVVLVDVGAGEYRDKSVVIVCKVIGNGQPHEQDARRVHVVDVPVCSNSISETALIGELAQIMGRLSNAVLAVDGGGIGGPLIKRLRENHGLPSTVKILWGNPCFKKTLKEVFFNQRAQAMVTVARATKAMQLTIAKTAFHDSRHITEMLDQGSRIPYHFNDKAQYVIESKRSKEWEGLPSPDIWDAISFAFLEEVHYLMRDVVSAEGTRSAKEAAVDNLQAELAAALGEMGPVAVGG